LGVTYRRNLILSKAKQTLLEGLSLSQELDNNELICAFHHSLGDLEADIGEFDKAEVYLAEALRVADRTGLVRYRCMSLLSLARLHLQREASLDVKEVLTGALDLAVDSGLTEQIAEAHYLLSRTVHKEGDLEGATALARDSLSLFAKMDHYERKTVETWLQTIAVSI
jgi:tetratricopeptide (TPR) repeat protein